MIRVCDLSIAAGSFRAEGISFELPTGAYAVLMGRTGRGKTTLLETLCGLKRAAAGTIEFMGRDVTRLSAADRGIGYVPQDRALFRTMTVAEHLAFGPTVLHWRPGEVRQRVGELAELLGIESLLARKPANLSGGEAQRVALGRALASRPGILLLDEPLTALDEETRQGMYELLQSVQRRTGVTLLHVTHSPEEARRLADVVWVMEHGGVVNRSDEFRPAEKLAR